MNLESADPAEIGVDAKKLAAAEDVLRQGLGTGEYPCAVYLVARHGRVAACGALGRLGMECDPPATADTIFDVASITKPVATAASLMALVEMGEVSMDQPIADFFPECGLSHLSGITLHHLAAHTSGLPASRDLYSRDRSREEVVKQLLSTMPQNPPGAKYEYSCLGYMMLGLAVERTSGMSLAEFAERRIFGPLGMGDTCFNPSEERIGRIARTANCSDRDSVPAGEVHDGNAYAMGGVSGNAGLFSTASDLAVFGRMILSGGEYGGVRILDESSVRLMLTNRTSLGAGQSYGFFAHPNERFVWGRAFYNRAVGHSGFTGTSLLIDPEYDLVVVLLTNRVYEKKDASDFLARRRLFHRAVAASV